MNTEQIESIKHEILYQIKWGPDTGHNSPEACELMAQSLDVLQELILLRHVIDSRPAINAGLPETYIEWSQSIYVMDFVRAINHQGKAH